MRRGLCKLLPLLGLLLLSKTYGFAQDSLPDTVALVKSSVVLVVTYNSAGKPIAGGSGFCIAAGRIVTNNHVINGAARITVRLASGSTHVVKKVLMADKVLDLAILETGLDISQIAPLQLTSALPREGERLFVISNPEGLAGTVSDGIVSAIRRFTDGSILVQITAPISHGSSGGPVLNLKGQVIGVAVGSFKQGQSLNFMIPSSAVARLVTRIPALVDVVPVAESKNIPTGASKISGIPTFPKPEIRERSPAEAKRLYSEGLRIRQLEMSSREQNTAKLQVAISYFESATQVDPDLAPAWRDLGQTLWRLGRVRVDETLKIKAASVLREAIGHDPNQDETYALLARLLSRDSLRDGLNVCEPLIKAVKAGGFLCEGNALEGAGKKEEAIIHYRRGVDKYPEDARLLYSLANALHIADRYSEAISFWQRLLKLQPNNVAALRDYANTLRFAEKLDEAVAVYRRLIQLDDAGFDDHRDLISTLQSANRRGEAVLAAQNMVKRFPDDPRAWEELGSSYGWAHQGKEQITAFKKAVALAPDRASAHSGLGFAYYQSDRFEDAVQAYLQAIRIEPQGSTYSSLAQAFAKLGRYREALDAFAQAVKLDPNEPIILEQLGELYNDLGYYEKAIETYHRALQVSTGVKEGGKPALHYLIGQCYLNLGNRTAALEEYKILKSLDAQYAQLLLDSIYK